MRGLPSEALGRAGSWPLMRGDWRDEARRFEDLDKSALAALDRAVAEEAERCYLLTLPGADASAEPTDGPTAVNPATTDEPGGIVAARCRPED